MKFVRSRRLTTLSLCLIVGLSLTGCLPAAKKAAPGRAPDFAPGSASGNGQGIKPGQGGGAHDGSATPHPPVGPVAVLPAPPDQSIPSNLPSVALAYDMRGTFERDAADAAVVRLIILSGSLKGATAVRLSGKLTNLRKSSEVRALDIQSSVDGRGVIDVAITGLAPESVYKVTDLQIAAASSQGSERIKDPYFLATSGPTALAKARRKIVLKALAEAYDWDNRNYDRSKDYGNSGGWCDRFYSWSAAEITTLKYPNYAPSYFQRNGGLSGAAEIKDLGARDSLAGDMVRYDAMFLGNHTFMIVAFDQATGELWTVEGNFNNRVMRSQRRVENAFKLGHLTESMLR